MQHASHDKVPYTVAIWECGAAELSLERIRVIGANMASNVRDSENREVTEMTRRRI